jgi:hypothetical protein
MDSEIPNSLNFSEQIREYVRLNVDIYEQSSIEKVLAYLRENKISQFGSVYLLTTECGIPFNKANLYVMNSKTWNTSHSP